MDRLTKVEFPSLKSCDKCIELNECHQKQCVQVHDALLRLKHYEDLEAQLREVYGECDGLLEESIKCLVEHEKVDIDKPLKARLLTDGNVDIWEEYKSIGTVEECWEARERQRGKKRVLDSYCGFNSYECPVCGTEPVGGSNYCHKCGQRLE